MGNIVLWIEDEYLNTVANNLEKTGGFYVIAYDNDRDLRDSMRGGFNI